MQRILQRGEIESLDHVRIPRVFLPVRALVFSDRAARLKRLAQDSDLADYLGLMATLAQAQHTVLKDLSLSPVDAQRLDLAQKHGMPPLQATGGPRDGVWLTVLAALLAELRKHPGLAQPVVDVLRRLKDALQNDVPALEAQADALLAEREDGVDAAMGPFLIAALQVVWTAMACDFSEHDLPVVTPKGVCPVCGSLPVASVVRVGGQADACRYLCCSLCSVQWHLVRVTCSHCDDTEDIAYHAIEGQPEGIKAESCDHCHTYRKIFYQDKVTDVDAVADDLASLMLDMLMGDAGYTRASGNPLLWQEAAAAS